MKSLKDYNTIIIDFQYFGSYNYYKYLSKATHVIFDIYLRHEKKDFSTRCFIAGVNGPLRLSVPILNGRNQRSELKEILISNSHKWQKEHFKSLVSCYNNSPWFEFYSDSLSQLFSRKYERLMDWDLACFEWTARVLSLQLGIEFTRAFMLSYLDTEGVQDLRHKIKPGNYAEPVQSKIYYNQVFQQKNGFIPNLSILDMIFCAGPKRSLEMLGQAD